MIFFATPDFGAGAGVAALVVFGYPLLFLVCGGFFYCGYAIRKRAKTRNDILSGEGIMKLFVLIPLASLIAPPLMFVATTGCFPRIPDTSSLEKGMTKEEVLKIAGKPHRIDSRHFPAEQWDYYGDFFGLSDRFISFDKDGKFDGCSGH